MHAYVITFLRLRELLAKQNNVRLALMRKKNMVNNIDACNMMNEFRKPFQFTVWSHTKSLTGEHLHQHVVSNVIHNKMYIFIESTEA